MRYQKIILFFIACIVGIGMYRYFKLRAVRAHDQFVVGTAAGYAPFVSINQQGEYEGFDVDVAHALAKAMNKKLVLEDLGSMSSLYTALNQGRIDAIIWGLSITQDRLKKFAMLHYQGKITRSYSLLFWKTIPEGIRTMSDMKGRVVSVEPASSQDAVLRTYDFITTLPTEKVDDALLTIQYGKSDAAFVEPTIAKKFKNRYPEIQVLDVPLAPEEYVQGLGIAVRYDDIELINQIQTALERLKTDGTIEQLEQKWDIVS